MSAQDGGVRVVIYEDLQCPDSAAFRKMFDDRLLPAYRGRAEFESRDFPLAKHDWARKAAIAARLPELGWDFRRYVMQHQAAITSANFNTTLERYASDHGIDPRKAIAALADVGFAEAVQRDFEEGVARGVSHTPTVFVNGRPFIEHFTYEEIAEAMDSELAARR